MDIKQLRELEAKAYDPERFGGPVSEHEYFEALAQAAPYLFAVVEAAEKMQKYLDTPLSQQPAGARLAAHEALESALSNFRNAK